MAALVTALDNFTPRQFGENGQKEYTWSNQIREKIVQFSFQLTRQKHSNKNTNLPVVLSELLMSLKHKVNTSQNIADLSEVLYYLSILYKMIGHTRDLIDGKGEYSLTYMMIWVWYKFFPELAKFALKCLVDIGSEETHQYGSWKDMKLFCQYCFDNSDDVTHELIHYCVKLINNQVIKDKIKSDNGETNISLVAKWIPREKSKYGWLFEILAYDYFDNYILSAKNANSINKAGLKSKMEYRKIISGLNKHLDTVQIKQCANTWSQIDPAKQTSITMHKQKRAFLNLKKGSDGPRSDSEDRISCANNFKEYIAKAVKGEVEVKGKRVGLNDFTKDALSLLSQGEGPDTKNLIDLLNAQWLDNSSMTGALGKMIAMVDVSGSMEGDPMHAAIALGIRVAEKSLLGKRVMTFSAVPSWVNLDGCNNFVEMVNKVKHAEWGMNTNFKAALTMILDAIVAQKLEPDDVEDMVLAIFSDMQIDQADKDSKSMFDFIEKKYSETGIKLWGKPFKPPHILFWNLRSTSGFPTLATQKNTSMMSGFSPALLNLFCEEGINALQSCTPWSLLLKSLENERYKILESQILRELQMSHHT
jgi:hypothetical protein